MKKRKAKRSFDLLSNYNYFAPWGRQFAVFLLMLLLGVLIANLLQMALYFIPLFTELSAKYSMFLTYPVMFLPAMIYASYQSHRNELFEKKVPIDENRFGKFGVIVAAIIAAVGTIAGNFFITPLQEFLPPMSDRMQETLDTMMNDVPAWVVIISVSILAPFFEEWMFRGMILRGLLTKAKPITAIVVSSLLFGLIHGNLQQGTAAFLLGLLFGFVYYKTGSLKLAMLMHCANNLFSYVINRFVVADDTTVTSFREIMPGSSFEIVWIACAVATAAVIYAFSRIPSEQDSPAHEQDSSASEK